LSWIDDFWSRIEVHGENECWPWTGAILAGGYGHVQLRGISTTAHRVAYELTSCVEIPSDLLLCHSCDNPPCCNPSHHFVGDHLDNARDCASKGRHARLATYGRRILTAAQVAEARSAYASLPSTRSGRYGKTQPMMDSFAAKFGVSARAIRKAVDGETWSL